VFTLLLCPQPFNFVNVAAMAGGTKTPEYKEKFPIGQIPALEDGDFRLVWTRGTILPYLVPFSR
jgi:glutathione S-transferase